MLLLSLKKQENTKYKEENSAINSNLNFNLNLAISISPTYRPRFSQQTIRRLA
jgi:hypothetical protein